MTWQEAIKVLAQATEPQAAGQITRQGYVQVHMALSILEQTIVSLEKKGNANPAEAKKNAP